MDAIALLCDHAQVTGDGKLFISGANVCRVVTLALDPPMPVNFCLAIIVKIPWQQTNQRHKLTVELMYEDGQHGAERVTLAQPMPGQPSEDEGLVVAEFNAGRGPDMQNGEETLLTRVVLLQHQGRRHRGQPGSIQGHLHQPVRSQLPPFGLTRGAQGGRRGPLPPE